MTLTDHANMSRNSRRPSGESESESCFRAQRNLKACQLKRTGRKFRVWTHCWSNRVHCGAVGHRNLFGSSERSPSLPCSIWTLSERNWIRSRAGTVLGKFALGLQNWNSHLTGALVTAGSHLCASTENMTILRRIDPSGTRCSFDHCSGNDTSYGKVWFTHKDLRGLVDPSFPVTGHF